MKISIALATYNGEKYLQEQLDSYLHQERLPDELVVCDDLSVDNTLMILRRFKEIAPFKVVINENNKNMGYTQNFGKSLRLCTGDVVFFSDQDDVWLPNKIKIIEEAFLNNTDISVVIHDGELVNEKLESTGITKLSQIRAAGFKDDSFVTGTLSAIHKNLLTLVLPFPDNITNGHDGWIHTISKLVKRRIIIEAVLQKLRRHENNTSQWVVNSLKKTNTIEVFKSQFSTKPANSYEDRISNVLNLKKLFDKSTLQKITTNFTIDSKYINNSLESEYASLIKRQSLLSKSFIRRKIYAFSMLFMGDYKYFNGYKSFLRDFLR